MVAGIVVGGKWKQEAETLTISGKFSQAEAIYNRALGFFPWRWDLRAGREGVKLVEISAKRYGEVANVFAEFQEVPSIENLHRIELSANEVFAPILMYHHIRVNPRPADPVWAALNVRRSDLDAQLNYLQSHGFTTIDLSDLLAGFADHNNLPAKPVILTFDDGYDSFYTNAFPILKKYQMKAVQFVITGMVDKSGYLTWDQILEMDKSGLVQIGAHTQTHINLPDFTLAQDKAEIFGSKTDLEAKLGHKVDFFAYPYGSYSQRIIKLVQDAGFKTAVSTIYGPVQGPGKLYLLPRIMVDGRFSLDNLARRIEY